MRFMKASDMTYRDYLVGQALNALLQGTPAPSEAGLGATAIRYANAVIDELERDRADRQGAAVKK